VSTHANAKKQSSFDHMLDAAKSMPLLRHFPAHGETFDIMRSEVVRWLIEQPAVRQEIFNLCKRNGSIVYVDGKWVGAHTYTETQRDE
jgi:hypothetical protein